MNAFRAFVENLSRRKKAFVRLFVLLLVNGLVFAAVTHRLANKQERLGAAQERLSLELSEKAAELEALTIAEKRVSENADAVSAFWTDTVKPRVPGLTEAWEEIDRLASESNVKKGRIGYDRDLLDVGLEKIKASMPVEGDYFDLVRFINRLERSERFFLVEEVQLSQRESSDETIRLDCSIAFYLKAEEAASAREKSPQPERSASAASRVARAAPRSAASLSSGGLARAKSAGALEATPGSPRHLREEP